jgi:hypothetical protein
MKSQLLCLGLAIGAMAQDLFLKHPLPLRPQRAEISMDLKRPRSAKQDVAGTEKVIDFSSKDKSFRKLHAHRIPCPLMSSFYRRGWLNPDQYGRVEWMEMYNSLRISGASVMSSFFQTTGIVAYNETDYEQTVRNREPDVLAVFAQFLHTGKPSKLRYVNLFRMNPGDYINSHYVQHGFSTTIRDRRYDHMAKPVRVKEGEGLVLVGGTEEADEQLEFDRVRKLRRGRLDDWIGAAGVLDEQGRLYVKGLGKLLVDMKEHGDRSSEWSFDAKSSEKQNIDKYHPKASQEKGQYIKEPLSEWQAMLAWLATLTGFGQNRTNSFGGEYLTRDDLDGLFLDSELPKSWEKISWGFTMTDVDAYIEWQDEQLELKLPPQIQNKKFYQGVQVAQSLRFGMHYIDTLRGLGFFAD